MRRFLYWYAPLACALIATVVFACGLYSYARGDIGEPLNVSATSTAPLKTHSVPSRIVVPIILGDSLARGTGDESGLGIGGRFVDELRKRHLQTRDVTNLGLNGARTADLLQELDYRNVRTLLAQSNAIIISIGGNDLWGDNLRSAPARDPAPVMAAVLDRLIEVVKRVRGANPHARIYVIGLYNPFVNAPFGKIVTPLVRRWNAKLVDEFAADPNLSVVETSDIFEWHDRLSFDRFHPNADGYELIARRIADTF